MAQPLTLSRFSIGVGDRFALQAEAQLRACMLAAEAGVDVTPVWNKSNREHLIIGSDPHATRAAADRAVAELGWTEPYFVDADHIGLATVGRFLEPCDFFTIDVADSIGRAAAPPDIDAFLRRHPEFRGELSLEGIEQPIVFGEGFARRTAGTFLAAAHQAGEIYRAIASAKGEGKFLTEVSMDETASPQTPGELIVILAALADQKIPLATIAPKFTGRFNKGVDYVGDIAQFAREFRADIAAIHFAIGTYGLPASLKLSVHSGSDKFSLYPAIHDAVASTGAGVHLKTAGTTWLEELAGLAASGPAGLALAKEIYSEGYAHQAELCAPYASVIAIDPQQLPRPEDVQHWSAKQFVAALEHEPANPEFNPSLRQLLHVSFKIAAKMGSRYLDLVREHQGVIGERVTQNLFDRHIRPVFLGDSARPV